MTRSEQREDEFRSSMWLLCHLMTLFIVAHIGCVSCREYVQRAFEKCETEADKDQTEQYLKNMLTNAFKDGSAWVIDWDKELLPRYSVEMIVCIG